jgi:hypothetical protein
MHSLFRLKDQYLVYNCFAVLLNLAPKISSINSYTAERMVMVTLRLCKRIVKLSSSSLPQTRSQEFLKAQPSLKGVEHGANLNTNRDSRIIPSDVLEETLKIFLRVIGIALRPSKRVSNIHLIYSLIHESHELILILKHPQIVRIFNDETQFLKSIENYNSSTNGLIYWSGGVKDVENLIIYFLGVLEKSSDENSSAKNVLSNHIY